MIHEDFKKLDWVINGQGFLNSDGIIELVLAEANTLKAALEKDALGDSSLNHAIQDLAVSNVRIQQIRNTWSDIAHELRDSMYKDGIYEEEIEILNSMLAERQNEIDKLKIERDAFKACIQIIANCKQR
jgi:hypothetical protein